MSMVGEDPGHEQRPARSGGPFPNGNTAGPMEGAPEVIYLQTGCPECCDDHATKFSDLDPESVTWCEDEILDGDTKYVRADIVDRLRAENERLEKLLAANEGRIEKIVSGGLLQRAERAEAALAKGVVVPEEPSVSILLAMSKWFTGDTHAIKRRDCYAELLAAAKEGKSNG